MPEGHLLRGGQAIGVDCPFGDLKLCQGVKTGIEPCPATLSYTPFLREI